MTHDSKTHDANLSMSQAYVPLIHKFAPEKHRERNTLWSSEKEISGKHRLYAGPTIGDL